jgi:hypothetical protein
MDEKIDLKEKLAQGWLRVNLIIEVLGKPKDYIEKVIDAAIEQLGKEKGTALIKKQVHEATIAQDSKDVFITFGEAEIIVENLARLIAIIFDYMPASIEITEPLNLTMRLEDANALLNDLAARLHHYDALAKKTRLEREVLMKKLGALQGKEKNGEETEKEEN